MNTLQNKLLESSKVRAEFPVLERAVYLNTGTYGIMPEKALNTYIEDLKDFERGGVASRGNVGIKTKETYEKLAEMIGAGAPENIAFTRNATDGINLVLSGLDWQVGDEVITTLEEHEAMYHPLLYLHNTKGIDIRWLEVSPKPDVMIEQLEKVVTEKTRLIAMSLISCETGTRIPAQEICSWARERNILTLLDGAQATGAYALKMDDLGCDFYASNGHKWLCGPKGTGFFYGKPDKVQLLSPAHVGAGSLEAADIQTNTAKLWETARRFEFGTRSWGLYAGLGASLDWFEELGWANVYQHIEALSNILKNKVLERSHLKLLSPVSFAESSGLVSFIVEGQQAGEVSKLLRESKNLHVRVIPHFNAIRISTAHFNNEEDLDILLDVLDSLK